MRLDELLKGVEYTGRINPRTEIYDICTRSQDVFENTVFVAIRGRTTDAHRYIDEAVENGASCIVCEDASYGRYLEISVVIVKDARHALAVMSANWYGNPSEGLRTVGITGTNGKTTTSYMIRHILTQCGESAGVVGTLGGSFGNDHIGSERTTPESKDLHGMLSRFVCGGCRYAVLEVSSQGLAQHRTDGITFDVGIFTNLSPEHLDYHTDMEDYFRAKALLCAQSRVMLVNADDAYASRFSVFDNIRTFSCHGDAHYTARNIRCEKRGIFFDFVTRDRSVNVSVPVIGRFNVYNALAALSCCEELKPGIVTSDALLTFGGVPGRMEKIVNGLFDVYIDFAHTPEALGNILETVRDLGYRRILVLFGCGGDRDAKKRPLMARIATEKADYTVITSDNPRFEDPDKILRETEAGVRDGAEYVVVPDRREAIGRILSTAREGDAVILAGKGHEKTQITRGGINEFDEKKTVLEYLNQ